MSSRRFHVRRRRHPVVVDIGCGCRKPRLLSLLSFSRNGRSGGSSEYNSKSSSSSSSGGGGGTTTTTTTTTTITNSTFSPATSSSSAAADVSGKGKRGKGVVEESVAVEKDSCDPYVDFKESMVQMILEREMYGWEELREMLHLFLSLNSPYHHHLILRAFTEIWEGLFSPPPQ